MSTSQIIAATFTPTSLPSQGSASHNASGDNADFHQLLQQMAPGVSSRTDAPAASVVPPPDSLPTHDDAAFPSKFSLPVDPTATKETLSAANVFVISPETQVQPDTTDAVGSNHKKGKATSKTVPVHAAGASREGGVKEHPHQQSDTPNPPVVALGAVSTSTEPSLLTDPLISADLVATARELSNLQQSKVRFDPLVKSTSAPTVLSTAVASSTIDSFTAASSPATADPSGIATTGGLSSFSVPSSPTLVPDTPEPTSEAIFSTVDASSVKAKPKAQPQAPMPFGRPGRTGNNASPSFETSPNDSDIVFPLAREQFINSLANSPLRPDADSLSGPAAPRSDRSRSGYPRNNPSGAQEKGASRTATTDPLSSVTLASAVTAHTSPFQLSPVQPGATPTLAAATPDAALSVSTVLAQPSQNPTPVSSHAQPHIKSNFIPDPPRMVDSGQLRVTANRSELKISVQLPELGKVEIRAVTAHDITTAHLTASGHDALQVLVADRTGLEQALKTRDVVLGVWDSNTQGQSAGQQRQQNFQSHSQLADSTSSIATEAGASSTAKVSTAEFLPDHSSISVRA